MLTTSDTLALADRLRLAVGRLARRLRQQSLGGLTPSQRSVLATLDRCGPVTMSRLAEIEGVSRPAATGIASRLVQRGLVERRAHPDDRRSAMVVLTEEGRAVLEEGRRERTAVLAVQVDRLSDVERRQLAEAIDVLDRLVGEA
jgi:DNA-binding MarR family transcriptional regulator